MAETTVLRETDKEYQGFGVTITSRARHAALLKASRKFGSIRAFADHLGVHPVTLSKWINLKAFPQITGKQRAKWQALWPKIAKKLIEETGLSPEQLFPEFVRVSGLLEAEKTVEKTQGFTADQLAQIYYEGRGQPAALPSPEEAAIEGERRLEQQKVLSEAFRFMRQRHVKAIELHYGLNGNRVHNYVEGARELGVTKERFRQILMGALRKLREKLPHDAHRFLEQ